jgi:dimethylargininase
VIAITRAVSDGIVNCELTHYERVAIDVARARAQHAEYERGLEALGCTVVQLAAGPELPDSVFIEDTAVVFDEVAIVTRPGAVSRRAETPAVVDALSRYRALMPIEPPGTLDGGDVLVVGRAVFVGASGRSNREGIEQLGERVAPFGYEITAVAVSGCLHLKSAVTALSDEALLINREWVEAGIFNGFELVDVDRREPSAANVLRVGDRLLYAAAFPRTLERLMTRGLNPLIVDASELAKAEGAVTCGSLLVGAA